MIRFHSSSSAIRSLNSRISIAVGDRSRGTRGPIFHRVRRGSNGWRQRCAVWLRQSGRRMRQSSGVGVRAGSAASRQSTRPVTRDRPGSSRWSAQGRIKAGRRRGESECKPDYICYLMEKQRHSGISFSHTLITLDFEYRSS